MEKQNCYICEKELNLIDVYSEQADKFVKIKDTYFCSHCYENERNQVLSFLVTHCGVICKLVASYDLYLKGEKPNKTIYMGNTNCDGAIDLLIPLGVETNIDIDFSWKY